MNTLLAVSRPVGISEENGGFLEQNQEVRWQIEIPATGQAIIITAEQGEVVFYASTETTAPNEAFHQWTIRTSSSATIFIIPIANNRRRRQAEPSSNTTVSVFTTVVGVGSNNSFTLTGGGFEPPTTELEMVTTIYTTEVDNDTATGKYCKLTSKPTAKKILFTMAMEGGGGGGGGHVRSYRV